MLDQSTSQLPVYVNGSNSNNNDHHHNDDDDSIDDDDNNIDNDDDDDGNHKGNDGEGDDDSNINNDNDDNNIMIMMMMTTTMTPITATTMTTMMITLRGTNRDIFIPHNLLTAPLTVSHKRFLTRWTFSTPTKATTTSWAAQRSSSSSCWTCRPTGSGWRPC